MSSINHWYLPWILIGSAVLSNGCASNPLLSHMPRKGAWFQKSHTAETEPQTRFFREFVKGRTAEQSGKIEEAKEIYQRLLTQYPDHAESYHRLGVIADRQRRFNEAQKYFTGALRLEPQNAEILNDLGYCFYLQGKLEKAESALLKAISLSPMTSRYQNNLGMVYGHLGRLDESLAQFRQAGSEADAQFNLAFVHAAKDDFDSAKMCIQRALSLDPQHKKALRAHESFAQIDSGTGVVPTSFTQDSSIHWVPYVEGSESDNVQGVNNSFDVPSVANHISTHSRAAAIQSQSRALGHVAHDFSQPRIDNTGVNTTPNISH